MREPLVVLITLEDPEALERARAMVEAAGAFALTARPEECEALLRFIQVDAAIQQDDEAFVPLTLATCRHELRREDVERLLARARSGAA